MDGIFLEKILTRSFLLSICAVPKLALKMASIASSRSTATTCSEGHTLTKNTNMSPFQVNDLVLMHGLKSVAGRKLNGLQATVIACDASTGVCDCIVADGDGSIKSIKMKNLKKYEPPTRDCSICMETFLISQLQLPSSKCTHEPVACDGCLRLHIAEEVNGKGITREIKCPLTTCGKKIEHHELHRICKDDVVGRLTFDRFDSLLFRRTVEKMPDFVWCTGENCGSGQLHVGGNDTPIVRCTGCSAKTCFLHKSKYHDGLSCTEHDASIAEAEAEAGSEALNEAWKLRNTKPCPNCGIDIQKGTEDENGELRLGCCHMTCEVGEVGCKHEFCWHCSAPWQAGMLGRRGAHHHEPTCCKYMEKE